MADIISQWKAMFQLLFIQIYFTFVQILFCDNNQLRLGVIISAKLLKENCLTHKLFVRVMEILEIWCYFANCQRVCNQVKFISSDFVITCIYAYFTSFFFFLVLLLYCFRKANTHESSNPDLYIVWCMSLLINYLIMLYK